MDLEKMSREELIGYIEQMNRDIENVIVVWGDKRALRETLQEVAKNESQEFTEDEARNARTIMDSSSAFDELIELIRESFERGGIHYAISEKMSALMEEVAGRHGTGH